MHSMDTLSLIFNDFLSSPFICRLILQRAHFDKRIPVTVLIKERNLLVLENTASSEGGKYLLVMIACRGVMITHKWEEILPDKGTP